jgi:hypothetical protein
MEHCQSGPAGPLFLSVGMCAWQGVPQISIAPTSILQEQSQVQGKFKLSLMSRQRAFSL